MSLFEWTQDQQECCELYASLLSEAPDFVRPLAGCTVAIYSTLSMGLRAHHGKEVDPLVIADLAKFVTETAYRYKESNQ